MESSSSVVFVVFLVFILFCGANAQQVPCYFIFGDSLVNNENYNRPYFSGKADYMPYGIDFPNGPTGRFSNGLTLADFISNLLGFPEFIPPFLNATDTEILRGVNFASADAIIGYKNEASTESTGATFSDQVRNYLILFLRLENLLLDDGTGRTATDYVSKCIFSIGLGSNDYLLRSFAGPPEAYVSGLIREYLRQLTALHDTGARKFVLHGLSPIGCIPTMLALSDGRTCVQSVNSAIDSFNRKLKSLTSLLRKAIYINTYGIYQDLLNQTAAFGFSVTNASCCVSKPQINNGPRPNTCKPLETPCANRDQYVFWDGFRPTEKANEIIARRSYSAESPSDAYPIDISRLALL